ncbi:MULTISPECIES: hypothetical protein [Bacillaceae]|uniref:Uncharacterized protein n=1 Tax=Evansella alkalicola TaxID=745819 RepID=A0ABS6K2J3_9BACI|nr:MULTISPECIES: hypothetical protein [Bacillaceae]MBU9724215.1 hypothetical protein [Bacillus alkalicola]
MQRLLFIIAIILSVRGLMKNRFRLLNTFLSNKWLRTLSVALVMRIPGVREKMMYQMLR